MTSRKQAKRFLLIYFAIVLAAVVFRIDNWPLSWVPMYAAYDSAQVIPVRVWNKAETGRGFLVLRQDGASEYVNAKRLNIPRTKFIRLYYERIYGQGPPKDGQSHRGLSSMNRYLRELFDPDPASTVFWDWRILYSLNRSLGREPGEPGFIVEAQATALERVFRVADLNDGGGATSVAAQRTARAIWKDKWLTRWQNDEI